MLRCVNFLNVEDRHYIVPGMVAMCNMHVCAVRLDDDGMHRTLTCSGAILRIPGGGGVGSHVNFFNPVNIRRPLFDELTPLPPNTVDFLAFNYEYYYVKDSRTTFAYDIADLSCTNGFTTCVRLTNNETICMGNEGGVLTFSSLSSFIIGFETALVLWVGLYILFRPFLKVNSNLLLYVVVFVIPSSAFLMIMSSTMALSVLPCALGFLFIALGTAGVKRVLDMKLISRFLR